MTCKNCIHFCVCFDSEGTTRYYGQDAAANNVEDLCPCFATDNPVGGKEMPLPEPPKEVKR